MMRTGSFTLVFLYISFFSSNILAQANDASGIVSYTYYVNLGKPVETGWKLLFKGGKSVFMRDSNVESVNNSAPKGFHDKAFEIKVNDQLTPHIINDFGRDSIYSQG